MRGGYHHANTPRVREGLLGSVGKGAHTWRAGMTGPVSSGGQKHQLESIARNAMQANGLEPDFSPAALAQLAHLAPAPTDGLGDLRALPWSSIDNDDSRDLDQIEVCIRGASSTRVLVAIADVDALVPKDSPLDAHAHANTTSVYTPVSYTHLRAHETRHD